MRNSRDSEAVSAAVQDTHAKGWSSAGEMEYCGSAIVAGPKKQRSANASAVKPAGCFSRADLTGKAAHWIGCAIIGVVCVLLLAGSVAAFLDPLLTDGLEEHKSKNYKKAVELYTTALKKNPRSPEAFNWRGMAYEELGELDKALSDYEDAIRLEPKYADVYNNRGEAYRRQDKLKLAIADYKKAIELEKEFAEPHFNLGIVYEQQGKKADAVKAFRKYLELAPKAPDKAEIIKKVQALGGKGPAAARRPAARPGLKPRPVTTPPPRVAQKPGEPAPKVQPPSRPGPPRPGEPRPGVQPPPRPGVPRPAVRPGPPGGKALGFDKKAPAIPGMPPELVKQVPPEVLPFVALAAEYGPILQIASVVWMILYGILLFLIARKLVLPLAWLGLIPVVNVFTFVRCGGKPWWWIILLLIPCLNIIFVLLVCVGMARERGKSIIWGILTFLLPPIGMAYLALSR